MSDLANILGAVQEQDYANWHFLGLYLGLLEPTLGDLEEQHRGNHKHCMKDVLMKWLEQADNVANPSWNALAHGIKKCECKIK